MTGAVIGMMSPSATSVEAARRRQDDRAKDALSALQSLKTQSASVNEDKKAAARKKVEALKARIRALRMTMAGDPDAVAKMAAQLARELGAAVKAYAAAGGSAAGMGMQSTPAAPPAAADATAAEPSPEVAAPATNAAASPEARTAVEADAADDESAKGSDPYRQVIERQQQQGAEQARKNADKQADATFAADAKSLVSELKAILRQAAHRAKREDGETSSPDQKAADDALDQVQKALGDIASPMAGLMDLGAGISIQI